MAKELDQTWDNLRGFEVLSVGIASVSYDEESKKLVEEYIAKYNNFDDFNKLRPGMKILIPKLENK